MSKCAKIILFIISILRVVTFSCFIFYANYLIGFIFFDLTEILHLIARACAFIGINSTIALCVVEEIETRTNWR